MGTSSTLQRSAITTFSSWTTEPVVSIFVPQDTTRPDTEPTRLKASVQWAHDELLRSRSIDPADAAGLLSPLNGDRVLPALVAGNVPTRGVAYFAAPGHHLRIPLADRTDDAVIIGPVADTLRLLPHLLSGPEYHVLTVSQNHAQLFSANRLSITPVQLAELPKSLEDALWYVKREPSLERHGSGAVHTSGGGQQFHKEDIAQYLHLIDRAVTAHLADSQSPLVVMGVAYEASMYINSSRYRHVVRTPVPGNADHLDLAGIHERTWAVMEGQPGPAQAAAERARNLIGTGRILIEPADIAASASQGAIDQLLVSAALTNGLPFRGLLDGERAALCRAVIAAMASGARIHVVQPEEMPGGARGSAAVLRY